MGSDLSRTLSVVSVDVPQLYSLVDDVSAVHLDGDARDDIPDLADCSLISVQEFGVSGFITICDNAVRKKFEVRVTETAWKIESDTSNIHDLMGLTPEDLYLLAKELMDEHILPLTGLIIGGIVKMVECGIVTIEVNRHSNVSKYVLRAASMGPDVSVYC